MYSRNEIDEAEIREWLNDNLGYFLRVSGRPFVLFKLGRGLQSCISLERALRSATASWDTANSIPALADRIKARIDPAPDPGRLGGLAVVVLHVVVLNSIAESFSSEGPNSKPRRKEPVLSQDTILLYKWGSSYRPDSSNARL